MYCYYIIYKCLIIFFFISEIYRIVSQKQIRKAVINNMKKLNTVYTLGVIKNWYVNSIRLIDPVLTQAEIFN